MGRPTLPGLHALTIMLLVCVLAIRIAIPAGFMWTADHGTPTLVGCPSADPPPAGHMAMSGHHQGPAHHGQHDKANHPCAFAAASAAVDLAALAHPVATLSRTTQANGGAPLFARPGLGLAAPPPPKTGPPAFG